MHPVDESDIFNTIDLVENYLKGKYTFGRKDLEYLLDTTDDATANPTLSNENAKASKNINYDAFLENLPGNLRGKRPRDMTKEEKKEFNFLSKKFRRMNEPKENKEKIKEIDRDQKANKRAKETEAQAEHRKEGMAKAAKKRRAVETEVKRNERNKGMAKGAKKKRTQETEVKRKERNERKEN